MTAVTLATARTPGAVAILQLHGGDVMDVLRRLTGREHWPQRRAVLCDFAGIDAGLAVVLSGHQAQLMPHGGPRVVQKLIEHLTAELGCAYDPEPDTQAMYPEARSPIEADMLDAIARAASPAAIDLLAAQPQRWAGLLQQPRGGLDEASRSETLSRSQTLDRLINPPTVVVVGPANVGKSTLTNALMGRSVSIVADLPGTTRDWIGGLVELGSGYGVQGSGSANQDPGPGTPYPTPAVAVHWLDTPGLRDAGDAIEQRSIALARQQVGRADVLIAMRDLDHPWPAVEALPREPDLWVVNKADHAAPPGEADGLSQDAPLHLSAEHGNNLDALQHAVARALALDDLSADEPWAFSPALRAWCAGQADLPADYLAGE